MKIENLAGTVADNGIDKKQWISPELVLIDKDYIQGGVIMNELENATFHPLAS